MDPAYALMLSCMLGACWGGGASPKGASPSNKSDPVPANEQVRDAPDSEDLELDAICQKDGAIHVRTEIACSSHDDCSVCLGEVIDSATYRSRGSAKCTMPGVELSITGALCCEHRCAGL
jgi:hypothetical protein